MTYEVKNQVLHLSFNRPHRANALDLPAWQALRQSFERADADEDVRAVILRGEGKHFCAGIDLSVLGQMQGKSREETEAFILELQDCITAIERCGKPVIAAVRGGCIGGGVDIVTACDLRFCTVEAYFTVKEVDLGIVADLGTLQRLPHILQPGLVAELAFTGRKVFGLEAARIGLVSEAFSSAGKLEDHLGALAGAMVAKNARVLRGIKANLLYARDNPTDRALRHVAQYSAHLLTDLQTGR